MSKMTPPLPALTNGYAMTRFNALRHGILSRHTVLPWEDAEEYRVLLAALAAEHAPQGPTEEHLVEELAGTLWRKRRLRLAEAAVHRKGLKATLSPYNRTAESALAHLAEVSPDKVADAVQICPAEWAENETYVRDADRMARGALDLLRSPTACTYDVARSALHPDTLEEWEEKLTHAPGAVEQNQEPYRADSPSLVRFLEREMLPHFQQWRQELARQQLIREQAFGDALDPDRLEQLGRYEVHLDRKLERTLTMLLRLKDLRRAPELG